MQAIAIRHPAEWQGMDVEATKKHPTLTNRSDIVEEKVIVRGTNEMNLKRLKKVKGIVSRLGAVSIKYKKRISSFLKRPKQNNFFNIIKYILTLFTFYYKKYNFFSFNN